MDRTIVYPGSLPQDVDMLNLQRNVMIAEGFLAQAMFGNGPVVNGLNCTPTTPASMQVTVGPGMLSTLQTVDPLAYGSLPADTADPLVKVGINLTATNFTSPAPTTPGNSINYLIEAGFSEADSNPVVLPYYNAANPSVAYSGPANSGVAQNTARLQRVALTLKAGAQAATGTQVTPSPDGGNVGLWVITVAYGATTIASGNIAGFSGAPVIGGGSLLPGQLINVQKWTAHGTYTYVQTPGSNRRIWYLRGAGGSGGSADTSAAGTSSSAGGGGGGGAKVIHLDTSVSAGATVVVGQGGPTPAAGPVNGNNGGVSSVTLPGVTLTAPGGGGGPGGPAHATSSLGGGGAPGAIGTGGNIINAMGDQGSTSSTIIESGNFFGFSGEGGEGEGGGGGTLVGGTSPGSAGQTPGAGGSGAASGCVGAGGAAQPGGAGADGGVWVWEYS